MTTELLLILIVGAAVGGWALLNALGAERQRLLFDLEAKRPRNLPPPQSPPPERPVIVKPVGGPKLASTNSGSQSKGPNNKSDKPGAKADKSAAKSGKSGKSEAKSSSRR